MEIDPRCMEAKDLWTVQLEDNKISKSSHYITGSPKRKSRNVRGAAREVHLLKFYSSTFLYAVSEKQRDSKRSKLRGRLNWLGVNHRRLLAYVKLMRLSLRRKLIFTHLKHIQTSNLSPNTLNSCPIEPKFTHLKPPYCPSSCGSSVSWRALEDRWKRSARPWLRRWAGRICSILMRSKRANLSRFGHELKAIGCLGIYCWFVCALGVWK